MPNRVRVSTIIEDGSSITILSIVTDADPVTIKDHFLAGLSRDGTFFLQTSEDMSKGGEVVTLTTSLYSNLNLTITPVN